MRRAICAVVGVLALSVLPASAHDADHAAPGSARPDVHSMNVRLQGDLPRSSPVTQSDLAFFGKYAITGNYRGFRIVDIAFLPRPLAPSRR